MRDARRRRFRREPDLNPELVQRVEKDLLNIMSGGTVDNILLWFRLGWLFYCLIKQLFNIKILIFMLKNYFKKLKESRPKRNLYAAFHFIFKIAVAI
ncbi:hypothetical protein MA16_Dca028729 [Dendrobium catenatum]|uniref:Uncharacterized protein n=1 Tax=Dendrobium catenatum TaxID=906689 RepID=A0A2I0VD62_9ASPA|nr:hypothetical protein MA16_Dca028729 [Dendrobium catenatum]